MSGLSTKIFANPTALINFADNFIKVERLPSLAKDVNDCLSKSCAFPAILYCFSTIDLLGALYKGGINKTTKNSRDYMTDFMKNKNMPYTLSQVYLLQKIFRHKVVHVAQPKPMVQIGTNKYAWRYEHQNQSVHLNTDYKTSDQPITLIKLPYPMKYNKIFYISISKLAKDIEDSVLRPSDGYWDMLVNNAVVNGAPLQHNFENAIRDIYDPKKVGP